MMTIVTRVKLEPGQEPAWDDAFRRRVDALPQQHGWISIQVGIPAGAVNERVVIGTWETRADWEAWHNTDPFQQTRREMDGKDDGAREEWWHEIFIHKAR